MSSLLFKNDIHNILPTITENSVNELNNIKINNVNDDNTYSATSSAFMNNINLNTATSTVNASQMVGGSIINSETSDLNSDINNLVSMLTSESNINTNKNISTPSLENKLRKMLNQDGGNFSDEMNTEELENKIYNIVKNNKQQGGFDTSKIVKIGLAASGAMLAYNMLKPNDATATETEINVSKLMNNNTPNVQSPVNPMVQAPINPMVQSPVNPMVQSPVNQLVKAASNPLVQAAVVKAVAPTVAPIVPVVAPMLKATVPPMVQKVKAPVEQKTTPKVASPQVIIPGVKDIKPLPSLSETSPMLSVTSAMLSATSPMVSETSTSENIFLKPKNVYNTQQFVTTTDGPFSPTSSFAPVDNRLEQLNGTQQMGGDYDDLVGGNNPALVAFRTIVKNVVAKLDIKYNKALKVAAKIQADVKSADPKISHEKLAEAADKQLVKNMKEYKEFSKTL